MDLIVHESSKYGNKCYGFNVTEIDKPFRKYLKCCTVFVHPTLNHADTLFVHYITCN